MFKYTQEYGLITYHCQQSVEKNLKGLLQKLKGELVKTNSLKYLGKILIPYIPQLKSMLDDLIFLEDFYFQTRYPPATCIQTSKEEVERCLTIMQNIRVISKNIISEETSPIRNINMNIDLD